MISNWKKSFGILLCPHVVWTFFNMYIISASCLQSANMYDTDGWQICGHDIKLRLKQVCIPDMRYVHPVIISRKIEFAIFDTLIRPWDSLFKYTSTPPCFSQGFQTLPGTSWKLTFVTKIIWLNPFSAGTDFRGQNRTLVDVGFRPLNSVPAQNKTSLDVRFWPVKWVPALK